MKVGVCLCWRKYSNEEAHFFMRDERFLSSLSHKVQNDIRKS